MVIESNPNEPRASAERHPRRIALKLFAKMIWRQICSDKLGSINTLATIISAIATLVLAVFAILAWRDARQQLIAGQGAFVFMESADFIADTSQTLVWRYVPRWRNSGGTPAEHLRLHVSFDHFGGGMPAGAYLKDRLAENVPFVLGPKAATDITFLSLSPAQFRSDLFFWGWASYIDTIDNLQHVTRFCQKVEGWQGDPNIPVAAGATPILLRNEATTLRRNASEKETGSQPKNFEFFNPIPFKPILALCNEGNCRDKECTEQAARYGQIDDTPAKTELR
jgi:hypothetical protein